MYRLKIIRINIVGFNGSPDARPKSIARDDYCSHKSFMMMRKPTLQSSENNIETRLQNFNYVKPQDWIKKRGGLKKRLDLDHLTLES